MISIVFDDYQGCGIVRGSRDKAEIISASKEMFLDQRIIWPDIIHCQKKAMDIVKRFSDDDADIPKTMDDLRDLAWAHLQFAPVNTAEIFEEKFDEMISSEDGRLKFAD